MLPQSPKTKIWVAGGSGLLGRGLVAACAAAGMPYVCTYNSRPVQNGHRLDVGNPAAIQAFLALHRPTVCINCVVERQVDVCERDWRTTQRVNIEYAAALAEACATAGVHFIHISTDYVFDGRRGSAPYAPDASPCPLQSYGISKLISEYRVRRVAPHAQIVRVPVLAYDAVESLSENAVTVLGRTVLNRAARHAVDNTDLRRPVYIPDMCAFLLDQAAAPVPRSGIWHFYNPYDVATKYQICLEIASVLGAPHAHILPAAPPATAAPRPYDTQLVDDKYDRTVYPHTSLRTVLERAFARWAHPALRSPAAAGQVQLLLDLDGTLVDSDRTHYEAYVRACAPHGVDITWEEFERAIHTGRGGAEALLEAKGISSELRKHIAADKKAHFARLPPPPLIAGVAEFLDMVLTHGVNTVVVTNTSLEATEVLRRAHPVLDRIPNWVTRGDYAVPKPAPDAYRVAVERYGAGEPFRIGVENTLAGVAALRGVATHMYYRTASDLYGYAEAVATEDLVLIPDFTETSIL